MSHNVRRLLVQLVFGIDTTAAIVICSTLGLIFGIDGSALEYLGYLAFAGFCSYLPDFDLLVFLPLRKRYGWTSHWVIGHYPIVVIPAATLLTFWGATELGLEEIMFLTLVAATGTTGHFIHDSMEECGFPWLAPLYWGHLSLKGGRPKIVPRSAFERLAAGQAQQMNETDLGGTLVVMSEPIPEWQKVLWCLSVFEFATWMAFR